MFIHSIHGSRNLTKMKKQKNNKQNKIFRKKEKPFTFIHFPPGGCGLVGGRPGGRMNEIQRRTALPLTSSPQPATLAAPPHPAPLPVCQVNEER